MNMRNILFSAVTLDVGGIENALVTLVNYLAQLKDEEQNFMYNITLVLEKKQGVFLDTINKRIKIIEYEPSNNKLILIRKAINFLKQKQFIRQYKNKFDFSCCYATYSLPASFVARTASKNSVLWVHSEYMGVLGEKTAYIKFFNNIKIDKYKKIVFVSKNACDIFKEVYVLKNKDLLPKIEVINNLINGKKIIHDSNEKINDLKKEKIYTFLNISRHTEEDKKISRLIKAADKLKNAGYKFRLILIGDGKDSIIYKDMANKLKLDDKLIFLGKKENPYPYYKLSDCFVLTSEYEGFPVVYNECRVLRLPIITTDVSDSKEVIDNKYGVVVEKNVESIFNAMKLAIDNGMKHCNEFNYEEYNKEIENKIQRLILY